MNRKRNVDKVVRGKRKPRLGLPEKVWYVTAKEVSGASYNDEFFDEQMAMKHAAWRHAHPGIVEVEISGPKYDGVLHHPTAADIAVGQAMTDLLDLGRVCPAVKYQIGRWMDSKAWGGTLDG